MCLQDTAVYPLMRGTGMITMGSHAEAIKHEAAWRDRINLPDDDYEHRHEAKGTSKFAQLIVLLRSSDTSTSYLQPWKCIWHTKLKRTAFVLLSTSKNTWTL